ncbi:MAG: glycerol kinase [Flavobacterium sp.]|jgi:glycerol kinase
MPKYIVAMDQGTTSSRAVLFDSDCNIVNIAQKEFEQFFPDDGWVEHDPEEIWETSVATFKDVLAVSKVDASDIMAIGITNQRETTVVWEKATGNVIHKAIVWQDRRTAAYCEVLKAEGFEETIKQKTGLLLDPYFSGTKLKWILDSVPGARDQAAKGELLFGTIDTFLLWRLTKGESYYTDATNASRTLLFNIHTQEWDEELLEKFDIPRSLLPEVRDSSADFGLSDADLFGAAIPITGMAGDQHCALFGQGCFESGMLKSTYGTGCFAILNTGSEAIQSDNKLLTTIAYRLNGEVTYALEGSIFIAGAAVQWLRDKMKLISHASETEAIAERTIDSKGVYLVPAFTGLGAPYWDADARGALVGLTRDAGADEIVVATLQSVCYQTRDLLQAMSNDGLNTKQLRVDGGMVANNWLSQCLADILKIPVDRPVIAETTALGACYLAGLGIGHFASIDDLKNKWQLERKFLPLLEESIVDQRYQGWLKAVQRVRTNDAP